MLFVTLYDISHIYSHIRKLEIYFEVTLTSMEQRQIKQYFVDKKKRRKTSSTRISNRKHYL